MLHEIAQIQRRTIQLRWTSRRYHRALIFRKASSIAPSTSDKTITLFTGSCATLKCYSISTYSVRIKHTCNQRCAKDDNHSQSKRHTDHRWYILKNAKSFTFLEAFLSWESASVGNSWCSKQVLECWQRSRRGWASKRPIIFSNDSVCFSEKFLFQGKFRWEILPLGD